LDGPIYPVCGSVGLFKFTRFVVSDNIGLATFRNNTLTTTLLLLDGIAQTGGVALFIAGFAAPRPVLVRDDTARLRFMPIPMSFGRSSAGFGIVGTF
jgi:hypothetical protein